VPAVGLAELREVDEVFTLTCLEPSHHGFTFESTIEPARPHDTDPDLTNNQATSNLMVECVTPVVINIKPGGHPNSVNPGKNGSIPVAVLTTAAGEYGLPVAFDATNIDPLTVRFGPPQVLAAGGGAFERHGRGHVEQSVELDEQTVDADHDMVLHFRGNQTGIGLGDTEACVKGQWMDELGFLHTFFGCDSIRIVPGA